MDECDLKAEFDFEETVVLLVYSIDFYVFKNNCKLSITSLSFLK